MNAGSAGARPAAFITGHTALASPPLVPELRLHLATELTPIWEATEAWLARAGIEPPFWAFAWPGGQAIARHLLDNPHLARGRRVLDFAAGCGIGALAAARAGAAHVEAVEIDPLAVTAIGLNAAANGVQVAARVADVVGEDGGWNLILAGDVCYEARMAARVLPWLRRLAVRAEVWLADPGRAYMPRAGVQPIAHYTVPTTRELEDREVRATVLYRLLPAD